MDLGVILLLAALIGLTLGAVGGGGSILTVPVLVGVVGLAVTEATTASLIVVGTAAIIGLAAEFVTKARGGDSPVRFTPGVVFGLTGIGGAVLGTRLNSGLDEDVLLVAFALLMLFVAATMARKLLRPGNTQPRAAQATGAASGTATLDERGSTSLRGALSSAGSEAPPVTTRRGRVRECRIVAGINTCQMVRLLVAGTGVGFLTGLFGVGGGFVIVPALVLVLGFDLREAAATSLVVIAVNSAVALALRADLGSVDWGVVLPFTAAATAGVLAGRRIADRVPARALSAALTVLIVLIALWTAAQGLGVA